MICNLARNYELTSNKFLTIFSCLVQTVNLTKLQLFFVVLSKFKGVMYIFIKADIVKYGDPLKLCNQFVDLHLFLVLQGER